MTPKPPSDILARFVVWGVTLLACVALISAALGVILKFQPYTLQTYTVLPVVVCPEDQTDVFFEADALRPTLGSVTGLETWSRWVNVETGDRLQTEYDPQPFSGRYGFRAGVSNFVRYAPREPGLWRIEAAIAVSGFQLLQPETQRLGDLEIDPIRTESVRVREADAPACRGDA